MAALVARDGAAHRPGRAARVLRAAPAVLRGAALHRRAGRPAAHRERQGAEVQAARARRDRGDLGPRARARPHGRAEPMAGTDASFSLSGRTAFVTGAGQGLGAAIARGLAEAGARVVLTDVDEPPSTRRGRSLRGAGARLHRDAARRARRSCLLAVLRRGRAALRRHRRDGQQRGADAGDLALGHHRRRSGTRSWRSTCAAASSAAASPGATCASGERAGSSTSRRSPASRPARRPAPTTRRRRRASLR